MRSRCSAARNAGSVLAFGTSVPVVMCALKQGCGMVSADARTGRLKQWERSPIGARATPSSWAHTRTEVLRHTREAPAATVENNRYAVQLLDLVDGASKTGPMPTPRQPIRASFMPAVSSASATDGA
jgi:hypothetical protein